MGGSQIESSVEVGAEPTGLVGRKPFERLKPGPGRPAIEVWTDQRIRLRRAMVQLVGESGYSKLTLRTITGLAGVSAETFYAQFDGKEECLVETYVWAATRLRERLASARMESLERPRQAERTVGHLLEELAADPHAARLVLIEAHAGGPAALRQIRDSEEELQQALRATIDRRGDRVSSASSRWLAAGVLHVARTRTFAGLATLREAADGLARWGRGSLERPAPSPSRAVAAPVRSSPATPPPLTISADSPDREVVLLTVLRLARAEGYWRLSARQIREATGLSAPRFKREFKSLEECYLAALRLLAQHLFDAGQIEAPDWPTHLHANIESLCRRVADDPELSLMLFAGILAPGVPGLRCREELIAGLGERSLDWDPSSGWRPPLLAITASTAGLWALICHELESGRGSRIPETVPTFSFFVLAPLVGAGTAAALMAPAEF